MSDDTTNITVTDLVIDALEEAMDDLFNQMQAVDEEHAAVFQEAIDEIERLRDSASRES